MKQMSKYSPSCEISGTSTGDYDPHYSNQIEELPGAENMTKAAWLVLGLVLIGFTILSVVIAGEPIFGVIVTLSGDIGILIASLAGWWQCLGMVIGIMLVGVMLDVSIKQQGSAVKGFLNLVFGNALEVIGAIAVFLLLCALVSIFRSV